MVLMCGVRHMTFTESMSIVMQSLSRVREHTMQQFTAVLSPWKSRPIMPLPLSRKVVLYDGPPGRLVKERVA
eukprot:4294985-Pyramimonas_sp.AAC.1